MSLDEWIATQYGPDKRYKSARQLSLAVSEGKNPNVVLPMGIAWRGVSTGQIADTKCR